MGREVIFSRRQEAGEAFAKLLVGEPIALGQCFFAESYGFEEALLVLMN
jgi:hypothetical protein